MVAAPTWRRTSTAALTRRWRSAIDAERFDAITRIVGSRASRRLAVGLVVAGLLGITGPPAEAARCTKQSPCPECQKCKKHKCKPVNGILCTGGGTCTNGVCTAPSACTPACTGGKACQANGTCACPPNKPHVEPDQNCDSTCRECCIDSHCNPGRHCDNALGGVCVCPNQQHDCDGDGVCWSCCTDQDCAAYGQAPADGFICTAQRACRCTAGTSACRKAGGIGEFCADLQADELNCGECGHPCGGLEPRCAAGVCSPV
jgi:hypothetical protein